jgi:hypothetical protein
MVNGFIDHLYTQLGSMYNYNAIANLHNSQITIAPAKPFLSCHILTPRPLVMASNSRDSSTSRSHILLSQPRVQKSSQLTISPTLLNLPCRAQLHLLETELLYDWSGRAIAEAVSRWFPPAAARVLVKWDLW